MRFSTMNEWLDWIGEIRSDLPEIELGLDRVKAVADRLGLLHPICPVVIVGGTNGKGSTVAGLEAVYRSAGYHVGTFTSPMLFKLNEQVRIDGNELDDQAWCKAFEKIAEAMEIKLTPFEVHALSALLMFQSSPLDVMILEVGLGGRLDAVNILDADASVVTSIDIDHATFLGNTREQIGFEKAGIFRSGKISICGDPYPPTSLVDYAKKVGSRLFCLNQDFHFEEQESHWSWSNEVIRYDDLPLNHLATQNMSTVLMTITAMQSKLPVDRLAIEKGLSTVTLAGRIQIFPGAVTEIFDVSHNPASVAMLANKLKKLHCRGKTLAVFSMLADKDMLESIRAIKAEIDYWYIAPLLVNRAASREQLQTAFEMVGVKEVSLVSSIQEAYQQAKQAVREGDRIVVFGSFHTVAGMK